MSEIWDSQTVAEELITFGPKLRRIIGVYMKSLPDYEATTLQITSLHWLMQERMTTSDLAKKRHVSLQAASTLVQGLVDRGWVERVKDPNDRRRFILEVTDDGKQQSEALQAQLTQHLTQLMADLSVEETAAAQVFLGGLNRIVQQYHQDQCTSMEG